MNMLADCVGQPGSPLRQCTTLALRINMMQQPVMCKMGRQCKTLDLKPMALLKLAVNSTSPLQMHQKATCFISHALTKRLHNIQAQWSAVLDINVISALNTAHMNIRKYTSNCCPGIHLALHGQVRQFSVFTIGAMAVAIKMGFNVLHHTTGTYRAQSGCLLPPCIHTTQF